MRYELFPTQEYSGEEVIYEYKELFPTTFIDAMHIDAAHLHELFAKYKAVQ